MAILNPVDDATFEAAWANPDHIRMMKSVAASYASLMSEDEWWQLMRIGMMNALRSHDYTGRRKFISSLRLRTLWVFQTYARGIYRKRRLQAKTIAHPPLPLSVDDSEVGVDQSDAVERLLEPLSDEEKFVVSAKYIDEMSLAEISRRTGIPRAHVGKLHKSGLAKLKTNGVHYGDH